MKRQSLAAAPAAFLLFAANLGPVSAMAQDIAQDLARPVAHAVRGAAAAQVIERLERVRGVTLPRGDLMIVTLPGASTALFWIVQGGEPVGAGYCPVTLVAAFLDQPA